jgi:hypothetical protein
MNENKNIGKLFIGGAIIIIIGCVLLHELLKNKIVKGVEEKPKENESFTGKKDERIIEVNPEEFEEYKKEEKKEPSQADIIFNNACRDTVRKRIFMAVSMQPQRRKMLINAINNLNCNPEYKSEKMKIYNEAMKNKDYNLMQKLIFDWAIRATRR